jgi:hypothetical protein
MNVIPRRPLVADTTGIGFCLGGAGRIRGLGLKWHDAEWIIRFLSP